jgi:hypothetical protein
MEFQGRKESQEKEINSKKEGYYYPCLPFLKNCHISIFEGYYCHGRLIKTGEEFMVANVYAPCGPNAKQGCWDALSLRLRSLVGLRVCVCGDFNAV